MEGKVMKNITNIRRGKMTKDRSMVLDNTYSESITVESQCATCRNERSKGTCLAYPKGIPMDIWTAKRKDCKFYNTLIEEME
jgi:hypothetical protein